MKACLQVSAVPSLLVAVLGLCAEPEAVPVEESLLRASFAAESLTVHTEFGTISIASRLIDRIDSHPDGKRIVLGLRNGDEVPGIPDRPTVPFAINKEVLEVPLLEDGGLTLLRDKTGQVLVCPYPEPRPGLLDRGLVVHLTFDGQGSGMVANKTKLTNPGVLVDGRLEEGALSLDGNKDHLFVENHESFEQIGQLTISLWVKIRSFGPGGYANEHGYLVNKGNDMWWNPAWCLGYSKRSGVGRGAHPGPLPALFAVGTGKSGGRAKCRLVSRTLLERGRWYHLAGTYNGREAMIFVNGRLENRLAYGGPIRRDKAPLLLGGGSLQGTNFRNHFTTDASIDNVRIYNRALSPGELRLLTRLESKEAATSVP